MRVVVDANIIAALVLPLPYSTMVEEKVREWKISNVEMIAPSLIDYELVSIIRKAVALDAISESDALAGLRILADFTIQKIPPALAFHERAIAWADKLEQVVAYDSSYLAVAEINKADFWTADKQLAVKAQAAGVTWVHWIGE
jgi:predicted nucleic acid-binding protein